MSFSSAQEGACVCANFDPEKFRYKDWKSEKSIVDQTPVVPRIVDRKRSSLSPEENQDSDFEWGFE